MEMNDIDDNTLRYIHTWYRNDIHYPLYTILLICLKRWNAGDGIVHTTPDFHYYGRSYIPPYQETELVPLHESCTFDQLYAHWRKQNFPRMSKAQQRDYDLCWKKMEHVRKIQFRYLRERDLEPCRKQSSPYTILVMYRLLYQMSRYACSIDIIDKIHFHPIRMETGNRKTDVNVLHEYDIDILFTKCEYEAVGILLFILYTGMQLKELFAIRKTGLIQRISYCISHILSVVNKGLFQSITESCRLQCNGNSSYLHYVHVILVTIRNVHI